ALPYREGEAVRRDEVVARVEDRALRSALEAAEAEATTAEADLRRLETLVASGAAARQQGDQARAHAASARSMLVAAREARGRTELRAPFAGRVSARHA